jgi:hypothetical protein
MKKTIRFTTLAAALAITGCATAPTGPSVLVLQGSGKSFDQFSRDDMNCRDFALRQLGGKSPGQVGQDAAVGSAVLGTVIGAAAGAAFGGHNGAGVGAGTGLLFGSMAGAENSRRTGHSSQKQYDNAYVQCMYGAGHRVPVPAGLRSNEYTNQLNSTPPQAPSPPPPPPPPPPPRY